MGSLLAVVSMGTVAGARAECPVGEAPRHDWRNAAEWVAALEGEDLDQRRAAAFALWSLRREVLPHVPRVARHLADPDPYVRSTIGKVMHFCGPRAAGALTVALPWLEKAPDDLREQGDLREELLRLTPLLVPHRIEANVAEAAERLASSEDARIRALAVVLLGRAGAESAARARALAERLLADGDAEIETAAVDALVRLDAVAALSHEDQRVRIAALHALNLGGHVAAAIIPLTEMLDDPEEQIRAGAAATLSNMLLFGSSTAPAARESIAGDVLEALQSEEASSVRGFLLLAAVRAAPENPHVRARLLATATDDASENRWEAMLALGEIAPVPPEAVTLAVRVARESGEVELRRAALKVLSRAAGRGAPGVEDALTAALVDPDAKIRGAAARAAMPSPSAAVADAARRVLPESDWWIQGALLDLLAAAGTGSADEIAAVRGVHAESEDRAVRGHAACLLLAWRGPAPELAAEVVDIGCSGEWQERNLMRVAVRTLAQVGHDVIEALRGVPAGSSAPRASLWRALLLSSAHRPRASDVAAIARALDDLRDLSAREENEVEEQLSLLLRMDDAAVRAEAACAYAALGWRAAERAEDLRRLATTDTEETVRDSAAAAVRVLRRRGLLDP